VDALNRFSQMHPISELQHCKISDPLRVYNLTVLPMRDIGSGRWISSLEAFIYEKLLSR